MQEMPFAKLLSYYHPINGLSSHFYTCKFPIFMSSAEAPRTEELQAMYINSAVTGYCHEII